MDFDFLDVKEYERIEQKALDALKNSPTAKEGLQKAYAVLKKEDIDESNQIAIFSLIVNMLLTEEGRQKIMKEGHKKEVQKYFKDELGIAWAPGYLNIDNGDGTISEIKLMRYYLADEPPSFLRRKGSQSKKIRERYAARPITCV